MGFKTINQNSFEGEVFKFENEGDSIQGTLQQVRNITVKGKPALIADLITEDGEKVSFFLSTTLQNRITDELAGELIRVTFTEWKQGERGGPKYKVYDLAVWEDEPNSGKKSKKDKDEIPF